MSHRISHNAPSKTNSCVKVLRLKAMLTDRSRLSHAGSFLGFPPLWSSAPPPVQAHTSSPAVGGVLEHALTCCTAWLNRQREREAATGGEARGWWSTVFPEWSDPHIGRAREQTPVDANTLSAPAGDHAGWWTSAAAWLTGECPNCV